MVETLGESVHEPAMQFADDPGFRSATEEKVAGRAGLTTAIPIPTTWSVSSAWGAGGSLARKVVWS